MLDDNGGWFSPSFEVGAGFFLGPGDIGGRERASPDVEKSIR